MTIKKTTSVYMEVYFVADDPDHEYVVSAKQGDGQTIPGFQHGGVFVKSSVELVSLLQSLRDILIPKEIDLNEGTK